MWDVWRGFFPEEWVISQNRGKKEESSQAGKRESTVPLWEDGFLFMFVQRFFKEHHEIVGTFSPNLGVKIEEQLISG